MENTRAERSKERRDRNLFAFAGAAAFFAIVLNVAISAISSQRAKNKKKGLRGSNVQVNLSASDITKLAHRIISKSKQVHDEIASIPLDKVSFKNVIVPIAQLEAQQFPLVQSCIFPRLVSTSDDVRKASSEAESRIDVYKLECVKREDVYHAVRAVYLKNDSRNSEVTQYIGCLVRDYERNGLHLTARKREEAQFIKSQISDLSLKLIKNLSSDVNYLIISEYELMGLSSEFMKGLEKVGNGKFKLVLRSEYITPILEHCKIGATRRMVAMAYGKRCLKLNLLSLENLLHLRHKLAQLLGHANYVDYVVEDRMAKASIKIFEFMEDISAGLTDLANEELIMLKDLKRKEEGEVTFGIEDLLYYMKRGEEHQIYLDFGSIRQHFPLNIVLSGMFKILQEVFGLRLSEVVAAELWHSDVQVFAVFDLSSGELLGYFYLDMYSRNGKYPQTCVVSLQNRSTLPNNDDKQIPVALLISQFQKEDNGQPTLLHFSEVVNLFHEFGHLVHHVCNRASFVRFSGLCVDPDFVEIPALVLENLCYEVRTMKLISGFHEGVARPLDEEIYKALKRRRYFLYSLKLKLEIFYCIFDQIIHSAESIDMTELYKVLHPKVMLGLPALEGTNPASSFPRCAVGYEAACYSRIWGKVLAADLFTSKLQDSLSTGAAGLEFREKVLSPGGTKDPMDLLKDFLGREPSTQAFIDDITGCNVWST